MKIPNLVVGGPILKDVESSLQVSFVLSLVENGLVVLKKMKMWNGRTPDDRRSEKLTWVFKSKELKIFSKVQQHPLSDIILKKNSYSRFDLWFSLVHASRLTPAQTPWSILF